MANLDNGVNEQGGQLHSRDWRVVGASIRGAKHCTAGVPCQDSHAWEILPAGALFIALADGAGSANYGEIGARIAVQTAICVARLSGSDVASAVSDDDYQLFLRQCFQESRAAVEGEALSRGLTPRDLATTLIVLVAKGNLVAAGQIGDGACVVGNCDDQPIILNPPQFGEYINETIFLTSTNALDELQISIWRGRAHSIACFCDGLQSLALKLPEGTPHRPFFAPLFHFIAASDVQSEPTKELVSFLRSPRVQERSDDDLTLILVHHS